MLEPAIGHFIEIKSRTWSRRDAEHKAGLANELLADAGSFECRDNDKDYIEVMKSE